LRYNFRALSILHASDRARSHFFERLVIQLARVILPHALGESYSILRVKRNVGLLTARLVATVTEFIPTCPGWPPMRRIPLAWPSILGFAIKDFVGSFSAETTEPKLIGRIPGSVLCERGPEQNRPRLRQSRNSLASDNVSRLPDGSSVRGHAAGPAKHMGIKHVVLQHCEFYSANRCFPRRENAQNQIAAPP
jgi:hypothetical protein